LAKITKVSIKRFFRQEIYNRGLKYFTDGRVTDLSYDLNYDIWTAHVIGTTTYYVEIDLERIDQGVINAHCDCPAFATFGSCKHNVAVLLAIVERQQQSPSLMNNRQLSARRQLDYAKQFTEIVQSVTSATQRLDESSIKQPMHVQYILSWTRSRDLFLELKTGIDYYYVVKDISELLHAVFMKEEHLFTPRFKYNPNEHYFLEKDLAIFQKIQLMIDNEKMFRRQWYIEQYERGTDRRYQTISPLLFSDMIQLLIDRDLTFNLEDQRYKNIQLVEGEQPFQFELTESDSTNYVLEFSELQRGKYFPLYGVFFDEGTFYLLNREQQGFLEKMNDKYIPNSQIMIPKREASTLLSDLIPSLEQISPVNIEGTIDDQMVKTPLQTKLYLDITDDMVKGTLEYHYDKYKINPFTNEGARETLIIRQRDQEEHVMQTIEQANFFYNGEEIYIELNDDTLPEFLYETLPMLEDHMEVYLTTRLKRLIIDEPTRLAPEIRVNESTQLLEIDFDLTGIDETDISEILQSVIEKRKFHRLKSGELVRLHDEDSQKMADLMETFNLPASELQTGHIELPLYRSPQLDEIIDDNHYDKTFETLLQQLLEPKELTYELPATLHAELRPYQLTGYQWLKSLGHYRLGGILADDMGLGKTLQAIAYLLSEKGDKPQLVIAPASVVYNWKSELNRFAPDLEVAMITGSQEERQRKIKTSTDADVWLTSYAMARQDIDSYRELTFHTLILDEAQYIKNYETKTSQAIRQLQATHRFGLSGTPIENNIEELWSIFQVIMPGFMPNRRRFRKLEYNQIAQMVRPFILRRLKKDVLTELPEKIESIHRSELTRKQKELYLGYLQQLRSETVDSLKSQTFNKQRMKILAGITRLRQICCHPSMFIDNYEGESGKLEQLIELVKTSIDSGKRMLIFSQFTSMHKIIIERLKQESIDYFYLHGGTPSAERLKMSEQFNQGEKSVFLISLRAGGTGLNLTGADTVILYDLWWNPAVEDQAADRAHRFGQKNVVQVIRLICEGTIEEKIYELQQQKRELIDQVIQPGETALAQLTEEDIKQLLNIH